MATQFSKTDLTPKEAVLLGVEPEFVPLLLKKDVTILDENHKVILVRTKKDYRDKLMRMVLQTRPELKDNAELLNQTMMLSYPVDKFDSGIQYLLTTKDGVTSAQVISQIDDYTHKIVNSATQLEAELRRRLSIDNKTRLRAWMEGTVITVKTILVDGEKMTFYSTRSKNDATKSRWTGDAETPSIMEEFWQACHLQNITRKDLEQVGMCFAFILRSPWSSLKDKVEKPSLVLFRTYKFGKGEYDEVEYEMPGAIIPEVFTVDQAVKYMDEGGVVMTMFSFKNLKFMTADTDEVYSWMNTAKGNTPDVQYFRLLHEHSQKAARFRSLLSGFSKKLVDRTIENLDANIAATGEYLKYCTAEAVKIRTKEKRDKKNPKDYTPLHKNKIIAGIVGSIMGNYGKMQNAEKDAKPVGRGKKVPAGRGKQARNWSKPRVNHDDVQAEFVMSLLTTMRRENPVKLIKLIKECGRLKKSDIAKLKRQQKLAEEANSPVTPTFGSKAQHELLNAISSLESIEFQEVDIFIPAQYDDDDEVVSEPKWLKSGDSSIASPTEFSDAE